MGSKHERCRQAPGEIEGPFVTDSGQEWRDRESGCKGLQGIGCRLADVCDFVGKGFQQLLDRGVTGALRTHVAQSYRPHVGSQPYVIELYS